MSMTMSAVRAVRMLVKGNTKLGEGIYSFSIPAGSTCPGQSPTCARHCYAKSGNYVWSNVVASHSRNWEAARKRGFVARMVREIDRTRPRVVRIHAAGDFYSAGYCRKWAEIARACPEVTFYAYTRSWRLPAIRAELVQFARIPNVKLWYSCDRDTGVPTSKPKRVRLAWMQADETDVPPRSDLVFRVKRLRKNVVKRVGLTMVCPVENGVTVNTDCGKCGVCWKPERTQTGN